MYKTTDTRLRKARYDIAKSPGPTKNKDKLNKHKHCQKSTWNLGNNIII